MLFLLDTVVVKTQLKLDLPPGLEALAKTTPAGVLQVGVELYARHPRLEHERPDIARWYCTLLQLKFPSASGVRFLMTETGHVPRLAQVDLPYLVRLWSLQNDGVDIGREVQDAIWSAPRRVA